MVWERIKQAIQDMVDDAPNAKCYYAMLMVPIIAFDITWVDMTFVPASGGYQSLAARIQRKARLCG